MILAANTLTRQFLAALLLQSEIAAGREMRVVSCRIREAEWLAGALEHYSVMPQRER
jgi:hypothetical protein